MDWASAFIDETRFGRWNEPFVRQAHCSNRISRKTHHRRLTQMTAEERLVTDFHGTGLTVGRHPMAHRRAEWNGMNIKRAEI